MFGIQCLTLRSGKEYVIINRWKLAVEILCQQEKENRMKNEQRNKDKSSGNKEPKSKISNKHELK